MADFLPCVTLECKHTARVTHHYFSLLRPDINTWRGQVSFWGSEWVGYGEERPVGRGVCLPKKTSFILWRIHSFLWPKPHVCPLQPGGRRKRNTVRSREREKIRTDYSGDRSPSLSWSSLAKWKECVLWWACISFYRRRDNAQINSFSGRQAGWSWARLCGINELQPVSSSGNLIYKSWSRVYTTLPNCLLGRLASC